MENNENSYEYDSLKDVIDTQNNAFNPGHFIATGRVPTTVSAPGNALPLAICCFIFTALYLFLAFVVSLWIISFVFIGAAVFCLALGLGYLRKAKRYYKMKEEIEAEELDDSVQDKLWQRLCPKCDKYHDIDYPKCPYCRYDYSKRFKD